MRSTIILNIAKCQVSISLCINTINLFIIQLRHNLSEHDTIFIYYFYYFVLCQLHDFELWNLSEKNRQILIIGLWQKKNKDN